MRTNTTLYSDSELQLLFLHPPSCHYALRLAPPFRWPARLLPNPFPCCQFPLWAPPSKLGNSPSFAKLNLGSNSLSGFFPPSLWNLCDRLSTEVFKGNSPALQCTAEAMRVGPRDERRDHCWHRDRDDSQGRSSCFAVHWLSAREKNEELREKRGGCEMEMENDGNEGGECRTSAAGLG